MPATFQEILNSRIVTFIVGEAADGVASEFKIHTSAIRKLSKPLSILTKENKEGPVVWKDVSKATFERFVQFAYTGDYSIPLPEDRTKPVSVTASPVTSPHIPNGVPLRKRGGSEASSATAVEPPENYKTASMLEGEHPPSTVLEKIEDDSGTILNYPTPAKKNKKKKSRAAVVATIKAKEEADRQDENANLQSQTQDLGTDVTSTDPVDPVESVQPERNLPIPPSESATIDSQSKAIDGNAINHTKSDSDPANPLPSSSPTMTSFTTLSYPLLAPLNNHASTCTPSQTFDASKSYSAILLSHAALYTLASTYLVRSLKVLSLWKLHQTLCVFELGGEREEGGQNAQSVGDITDLARYAYANDGVGKSAAAATIVNINGAKNGVAGELGRKDEGGNLTANGDGGLGEGEGEMRALVCAYLAGHAVVLGRDAGFMDLLAEGGQIVKDFFRFQLQGRG